MYCKQNFSVIVNGEQLDKQTLIYRLNKMEVPYDPTQEKKLYFSDLYNDAIKKELLRSKILNDLIEDECKVQEQKSKLKQIGRSCFLNSEAQFLGNDNNSNLRKIGKLEDNRQIQSSVSQFERNPVNLGMRLSQSALSDYTSNNCPTTNKQREKFRDACDNKGSDIQKSPNVNEENEFIYSTGFRQSTNSLHPLITKANSQIKFGGGNMKTPRSPENPIQHTQTERDPFIQPTSNKISSTQSYYQEIQDDINISPGVRRDPSRSLNSSRIVLDPITKLLINVEGPEPTLRTFSNTSIENNFGVYHQGSSKRLVISLQQDNEKKEGVISTCYIKAGVAIIAVAVTVGTILLFRYSNLGSHLNLERIRIPDLNLEFLSKNWKIIAVIAGLIVLYPLSRLFYRGAAWEIYRKIISKSFLESNEFNQRTILLKVIEEDNMSEENFLTNIWPTLKEYLDNDKKLLRKTVFVESEVEGWAFIGDEDP